MSTIHPISEGILLCYQDGELSMAETAPVRSHLEECAECRARFERLQAVSSAIAGYSEALADAGDGAVAAARLAEALQSRQAPKARSAFGFGWWRLVPACAAVVVFGMVLLMRGPALRVAPKATPVATAPADRLANGFIALPYSDQNLSPEGAVVIQVEVPRSAMLLAGAPVSDTQGTGLVKAEVVVGADGLARAIRFMN
jgi:anti-sigma factor RsiW